MPEEHGQWRAALSELNAAQDAWRGVAPEEPRAVDYVEPPAPAALVLIVDDERDIRFMLRFVLEKKGYRVVEAAHGASAVEMIHAESPALVITDLMMPVMDGAELIEILRGSEETASVPAVLVTACPEHGPAGQFDVVMRKPFTPDEITAVVESLLEGSRA